VHFDIIDQAGNMIRRPPRGGWLQSSPGIPDLGFCLGSRAQMSGSRKNHPAALAPGKRPRTTLSPTMALRDGEPYLAWGSPAAISRINGPRSALRHVSTPDDLQEAIDAPAWHSTFPDFVLAALPHGPGVMVSKTACRRPRSIAHPARGISSPPPAEAVSRRGTSAPRRALPPIRRGHADGFDSRGRSRYAPGW